MEYYYHWIVLYIYTNLLRYTTIGINAASTVTLELMMYGKPIQLWSEDRQLFQGLYVDDNAAACIVDKETATNDLPDVDTARMDACERVRNALLL